MPGRRGNVAGGFGCGGIDGLKVFFFFPFRLSFLGDVEGYVGKEGLDTLQGGRKGRKY